MEGVTGGGGRVNDWVQDREQVEEEGIQVEEEGIQDKEEEAHGPKEQEQLGKKLRRRRAERRGGDKRSPGWRSRRRRKRQSWSWRKS